MWLQQPGVTEDDSGVEVQQPHHSVRQVMAQSLRHCSDLAHKLFEKKQDEVAPDEKELIQYVVWHCSCPVDYGLQETLSVMRMLTEQEVCRPLVVKQGAVKILVELCQHLEPSCQASAESTTTRSTANTKSSVDPIAIGHVAAIIGNLALQKDEIPQMISEGVVHVLTKLCGWARNVEEAASTAILNIAQTLNESSENDSCRQTLVNEGVVGLLVTKMHNQLRDVEEQQNNPAVSMGMSMGSLSMALGMGSAGPSEARDAAGVGLVDRVLDVLCVFSAVLDDSMHKQMILEGAVPGLLRACLAVDVLLSQEPHTSSISLDYHLHLLEVSQQPDLLLEAKEFDRKVFVRQHLRMLVNGVEALANLCCNLQCRQFLLQPLTFRRNKNGCVAGTNVWAGVEQCQGQFDDVFSESDCSSLRGGAGIIILLGTLRTILTQVLGRLSFSIAHELPKITKPVPEQGNGAACSLSDFATVRIHTELQSYEAILVSVTRCLGYLSLNLDHGAQDSPDSTPKANAASTMTPTPVAEYCENTSIAVAPLILDSGVIPCLLQLCNDARLPRYLQPISDAPAVSYRRLQALVHCTTALRHLSCHEMALMSLIKGYYAGSGEEAGLHTEEDEKATGEHRQKVVAPCVRLSIKVGEYFVEALSDAGTTGVETHSTVLHAAATVLGNCAQIMERLTAVADGALMPSLVREGLLPPLVQLLHLCNEYTVDTVLRADLDFERRLVQQKSGSEYCTSTDLAETQGQEAADPRRELNQALSTALLPATAAIARIAHNAALILPLVRVGALSPLIHLCTHQYYSRSNSGQANTMANITLSLAMLAAHDGGNAHLMLAGVAPALVSLCRDANVAIVDNDDTVINLRSDNEKSDPQGLGVAERRGATCIPHASAAAVYHSQYQHGFKQRRGGAILSRDSRVLCNVVSTLADLACHRSNVPGLVQEGVIEVLVQLLCQSTSHEIWEGMNQHFEGVQDGHISKEGVVAVLSNVSLALSGLTDEESTIRAAIEEGVLLPLVLLCWHALMQQQRSPERIADHIQLPSDFCLPPTLSLPLEIICNVTLTVARLALTSDTTIITKIIDTGIMGPLFQLCLPQISVLPELQSAEEKYTGNEEDDIIQAVKGADIEVLYNCTLALSRLCQHEAGMRRFLLDHTVGATILVYLCNHVEEIEILVNATSILSSLAVHSHPSALALFLRLGALGCLLRVCVRVQGTEHRISEHTVAALEEVEAAVKTVAPSTKIGEEKADDKIDIDTVLEFEVLEPAIQLLELEEDPTLVATVFALIVQFLETRIPPETTTWRSKRWRTQFTRRPLCEWHRQKVSATTFGPQTLHDSPLSRRAQLVIKAGLLKPLKYHLARHCTNLVLEFADDDDHDGTNPSQSVVTEVFPKMALIDTSILPESSAIYQRVRILRYATRAMSLLTSCGVDIVSKIVQEGAVGPLITLCTQALSSSSVPCEHQAKGVQHNSIVESDEHSAGYETKDEEKQVGQGSEKCCEDDVHYLVKYASKALNNISAYIGTPVDLTSTSAASATSVTNRQALLAADLMVVPRLSMALKLRMMNNSQDATKAGLKLMQSVCDVMLVLARLLQGSEVGGTTREENRTEDGQEADSTNSIDLTQAQAAVDAGLIEPLILLLHTSTHIHSDPIEEVCNQKQEEAEEEKEENVGETEKDEQVLFLTLVLLSQVASIKPGAQRMLRHHSSNNNLQACRLISQLHLFLTITPSKLSQTDGPTQKLKYDPEVVCCALQLLVSLIRMERDDIMSVMLKIEEPMLQTVVHLCTEFMFMKQRRLIIESETWVHDSNKGIGETDRYEENQADLSEPFSQAAIDCVIISTAQVLGLVCSDVNGATELLLRFSPDRTIQRFVNLCSATNKMLHCPTRTDKVPDSLLWLIAVQNRVLHHSVYALSLLVAPVGDPLSRIDGNMIQLMVQHGLITELVQAVVSDSINPEVGKKSGPQSHRGGIQTRQQQNGILSNIVLLFGAILESGMNAVSTPHQVDCNSSSTRSLTEASISEILRALHYICLVITPPIPTPEMVDIQMLLVVVRAFKSCISLPTQSSEDVTGSRRCVVQSVLSIISGCCSYSSLQHDLLQHATSLLLAVTGVQSPPGSDTSNLELPRIFLHEGGVSALISVCDMCLGLKNEESQLERNVRCHKVLLNSVQLLLWLTKRIVQEEGGSTSPRCTLQQHLVHSGLLQCMLRMCVSEAVETFHPAINIIVDVILAARDRSDLKEVVEVIVHIPKHVNIQIDADELTVAPHCSHEVDSEDDSQAGHAEEGEQNMGMPYNENEAEDDLADYECEYDCGFVGTCEQVSAHESSCPKKLSEDPNLIFGNLALATEGDRVQRVRSYCSGVVVRVKRRSFQRRVWKGHVVRRTPQSFVDLLQQRMCEGSTHAEDETKTTVVVAPLAGTSVLAFLIRLCVVATEDSPQNELSIDAVIRSAPIANLCHVTRGLQCIAAVPEAVDLIVAGKGLPALLKICSYCVSVLQPHTGSEELRYDEANDDNEMEILKILYQCSDVLLAILTRPAPPTQTTHQTIETMLHQGALSVLASVSNFAMIHDAAIVPKSLSREALLTEILDNSLNLLVALSQGLFKSSSVKGGSVADTPTDFSLLEPTRMVSMLKRGCSTCKNRTAFGQCMTIFCCLCYCQEKHAVIFAQEGVVELMRQICEGAENLLPSTDDHTLRSVEVHRIYKATQLFSILAVHRACREKLLQGGVVPLVTKICRTYHSSDSLDAERVKLHCVVTLVRLAKASALPDEATHTNEDLMKLVELFGELKVLSLFLELCYPTGEFDANGFGATRARSIAFATLGLVFLTSQPPCPPRLAVIGITDTLTSLCQSVLRQGAHEEGALISVEIADAILVNSTTVLLALLRTSPIDTVEQLAKQPQETKGRTKEEEMDGKSGLHVLKELSCYQGRGVSAKGDLGREKMHVDEGRNDNSLTQIRCNATIIMFLLSGVGDVEDNQPGVMFGKDTEERPSEGRGIILSIEMLASFAALSKDPAMVSQIINGGVIPALGQMCHRSNGNSVQKTDVTQKHIVEIMANITACATIPPTLSMPFDTIVGHCVPNSPQIQKEVTEAVTNAGFFAILLQILNTATDPTVKASAGLALVNLCNNSTVASLSREGVTDLLIRLFCATTKDLSRSGGGHAVDTNTCEAIATESVEIIFFTCLRALHRLAGLRTAIPYLLVAEIVVPLIVLCTHPVERGQRTTYAYPSAANIVATRAPSGFCDSDGFDDLFEDYNLRLRPFRSHQSEGFGSDISKHDRSTMCTILAAETLLMLVDHCTSSSTMQTADAFRLIDYCSSEELVQACVSLCEEGASETKSLGLAGLWYLSRHQHFHHCLGGESTLRVLVAVSRTFVDTQDLQGTRGGCPRDLLAATGILSNLCDAIDDCTGRGCGEETLDNTPDVCSPTTGQDTLSVPTILAGKGAISLFTSLCEGPFDSRIIEHASFVLCAISLAPVTTDDVLVAALENGRTQSASMPSTMMVPLINMCIRVAARAKANLKPSCAGSGTESQGDKRRASSTLVVRRVLSNLEKMCEDVDNRRSFVRNGGINALLQLTVQSEQSENKAAMLTDNGTAQSALAMLVKLTCDPTIHDARESQTKSLASKMVCDGAGTKLLELCRCQVIQEDVFKGVRTGVPTGSDSRRISKQDSAKGDNPQEADSDSERALSPTNSYEGPKVAKEPKPMVALDVSNEDNIVLAKVTPEQQRQAVLGLANLAFDETSIPLMVRDGACSQLLALTSARSDRQIVATAALAVGRLAYHIESIPDLIEQGALTTMASLCQNALLTQQQLRQNEASSRTVDKSSDTGFFGSFFGGNTDTDQCNSGAHTDRLNSTEDVPALGTREQNLQEAESHILHNAVLVIGNLAFNEESADQMLPLAGAGAGGALVSVCREEPEEQDTQVLVQATAALVNLAYGARVHDQEHDTENEGKETCFVARLIGTGVVPSLLRLCKTTIESAASEPRDETMTDLPSDTVGCYAGVDYRVQANAALALSKIAENDLTVPHLLSHGCASIMVGLCSSLSTPTTLVASACKVVAKLAANEVAAQELLSLGAVQPLVDLCNMNDDVWASGVAGPAEAPPTQSPLSTSPDRSLPVLVHATEALSHLSYDEDSTNLFMRTKAFQPLIRLCQSSSDHRVLESCATALGNLAEDEDRVQTLVDHGALRPLIALLMLPSDSDDSIETKGFRLARIQSTRPSQIINIQDLAQVSAENSVNTSGGGSVRRDSNHQMLQERRESSQVHLKGGPSESEGQGQGLGIVENAALALAEFANHDEIVPRMVAEGVAPPLLYLCLHCESVQILESATLTLARVTRVRSEAKDGSDEFGGSVIGTEASDTALACFRRTLQRLEEDGSRGGDGLSGTLDHAIDVAIRTIDPSYSFQKLGDYLAAVTGQEAGTINLRPEHLHEVARAQLQEIGMADVVDSFGHQIGVDLGMGKEKDERGGHVPRDQQLRQNEASSRNVGKSSDTGFFGSFFGGNTDTDQCNSGAHTDRLNSTDDLPALETRGAHTDSPTVSAPQNTANPIPPN